MSLVKMLRLYRDLQAPRDFAAPVMGGSNTPASVKPKVDSELKKGSHPVFNFEELVDGKENFSVVPVSKETREY